MATDDARRARDLRDRPGPAFERDGHVVRLRSLALARQLLRERHRTTQAGFTSEYIPQWLFRNRPILISDGPAHDAQRAAVARFFAPKVVRERYGDLMVEVADRLLLAARRSGEVCAEELALEYAVEVTARVVGLTESPVPAPPRRLEAFFTQPPLDMTQPRLGRTGAQWRLAARNGLAPIVRFAVQDVRPAVRARRRQPREDVVSHLLAARWSFPEVVVECMTYGTAGMVTTREFIVMAIWHLLGDEDLRARYRSADVSGRIAVLGEVLRLEPPVGHLYRRVREDVVLTEAGVEHQLRPGDLVDIQVRSTNTDPGAVGACPMALRPGRDLPRGVGATVLAFGDGAHACPGQPLALMEAEVLITRLLELAPVMTAAPQVSWDDLVAGYTLRGMRLTLRSDQGLTSVPRPPRVTS